MGERKGQNHYYPPDFDYKKHRSLNHYHGTHALRERASKLHLGILIIRFEMPFNMWCDGCNNHIGMGVRYNAEKTKLGKYYTTQIMQFRMKCALCPNYIVIKTDPQKHEYVIVSGGRRQENRWDPTDNGQVVADDKADIKRMALDPMFKLEHGVDDKSKADTALPNLARLEDIQDAFRDDYAANSRLRRKFRTEKKVINEEKERDKALLQKASLAIELVPENDEDVKIASLLKYTAAESYEERQLRKIEEIDSRSIFSTESASEAPIGSGKEAHLSKLKSAFATSVQENKLKASFGRPLLKAHLGIRSRNGSAPTASLSSPPSKSAAEPNSISSIVASSTRNNQAPDAALHTIADDDASSSSPTSPQQQAINGALLVQYGSSDSDEANDE